MKQSKSRKSRETTAFLYERLSRDDNLDGDSYSIQNQKKLLTKVAKEKGYTNLVHFYDDGISGVTMDRPGFVSMLQEIEKGKAAAVFVKDLSRLGRNYIEVGRLTEEFFPEHDIRLVAVSDGIDTDEGENELAPIKNLFKVMFMSENGMIVADAMSRIHSILDVEPLPEPRSGKVPTDNDVVLENVTFRYTGGTTDALRDVTIRVGAGETVALVGPSGGGKTTVAGLISRFWDVAGGSIQIGGINVKDIPKETLMDTVAYVFQDSRLLKASILENVRLAKPNASRQEVERVLHEAQCDDIIQKLPQGIDTVIGTKGVYLSGGEQQRIAIARVMLKNAPILILDEATAFADPENEALVQRAFERLSQGRTVIMIAHRLTTIKNAGCIFVLREGRVEESGTHDTLVAGGGLYAKMWQDYQTSVSWKVGAAK